VVTRCTILCTDVCYTI